MAQIHKLELQAKMKSSPDKLFDIFKNKIYLLTQICPDKIQNFEVIEGDGKSVGSVRLWTYFLDSPVMAKDKIFAIDEKNKKITYEVIDGGIKNYFKSFKSIFQTIAETDTNMLMKWTLEYENFNEDIPAPHFFLEFVMAMSQDVDSYLSNPKNKSN